MSELAVSADDVAKFVRLQKAMYESGATPQVRRVKTSQRKNRTLKLMLFNC